MNVPFLDLKRQYASLREELAPKLTEVLENCTFIGGQYVQRFEEKAADYLGVKYAVGCGNGTEALVLGLRACGVGPGDEVITTPFTFFATAEAIASIGAVPVFADIKEDDYTLDPAKLEDKITKRTKAVLPVHIFGAPCEMDAILQIAEANGLKVIEDCAQAIGTTYQGRHAGSFGAVGCFSFYPTKNLGAFGDGGMVTTNSEELHTVLLALREHGAARNGARAREILYGDGAPSQDTGMSTGLYDPYKYYNYLVGYNSRLDALQAAVLEVKLSHLDGYNARRRMVARQYDEGLCGAVIRPRFHGNGTSCWHQYALRTDRKQELCDYLQAHGVGCGNFYPIPLHRQKALDALGYREGDLPVAELVSRQTVCLPIFPELTEDEVTFVIHSVNRLFEG